MTLTTCDVCGISLSKKDYPIHVNGKKHLKKIEQCSRQGTPKPRLVHKGEPVKDERNETAQIGATQIGAAAKKVKPNTTASVKITPNATALVKTTSNAAASVKLTPTAAASVKPTQTAAASAKPTPNSTVPPKLNQGAKGFQQKKRMGKRKHEQLEAKCLVPPATVDSKKPFDEQVNDFIAQVRQTENEHLNIQKVLRDVAFSFQHVMPNVIPVLYGSQATGLAFRTSDIDVYLCNPHGEENRDFVRQHGRAIFRTHLFSDIFIVSQARVPVIKAKHAYTGIELDISATSGQAVANSMLLRFIQAYDPRVGKLFMLIGYWAKKCALITVNKFSRYSINLLVIFYLQNLKYRILPPISELVYALRQKVWPSHIKENISLLQNRNYLTLHKLFMGFFEFYDNFPFAQYVISTYLGKKITTKELEDPDNLNSMPFYKFYLLSGGEKIQQRVVCIQDPLELNHNTSKQITEKALKQFELSCKKVIEMKEKVKIGNWLNEFLDGEVCKPVLIKSKTQEFSCTLDYKTNSDWINNFKTDFTKTLSILKMNTGTNLPKVDADLKKSKLDSEHIRFNVEATTNPFSNEVKRLISLLKNRTVDYDFFLKNIKAIDIPTGNQKFNFLAQCLVTSAETDKVNLHFTNEADHVSFYKVLFNLKLIQCVFSFVISEPKKVDEDTSKVDKADDTLDDIVSNQ